MKFGKICGFFIFWHFLGWDFSGFIFEHVLMLKKEIGLIAILHTKKQNVTFLHKFLDKDMEWVINASHLSSSEAIKMI